MNYSNQEESFKQDMHMVFNLCRQDEWKVVLDYVRANPSMALTEMTMDNHIKTTILHQAITSKSKISDRALVIQTVLELVPKAASIKNGYGSLPLHVICQRNTKMNSQIKEALIHDLIKAFPQALEEEGGVGQRTPLHIAFTDYISPLLAQFMISKGKNASTRRDKKSWLPIHVACSRHCSPEKLNMLLEANPSSLYAKTGDGNSLIDLAKKTATKSHPNFALVAELERRLEGGKGSAEAINAQTMMEGLIPASSRSLATPRRSKRKHKEDTENVADLLLHFSRSKKTPHENNVVPYYPTCSLPEITPSPPSGHVPYHCDMQPIEFYPFYQQEQENQQEQHLGIDYVYDELAGQIKVEQV
jgi:hypothetical protein